MASIFFFRKEVSAACFFYGVPKRWETEVRGPKKLRSFHTPSHLSPKKTLRLRDKTGRRTMRRYADLNLPTPSLSLNSIRYSGLRGDVRVAVTNIESKASYRRIQQEREHSSTCVSYEGSPWDCSGGYTVLLLEFFPTSSYLSPAKIIKVEIFSSPRSNFMSFMSRKILILKRGDHILFIIA